MVLQVLSVAPVAPKAPCGPAKPGVRAQPAVKPSDMSAAAIGLRLLWCVGATLHILHHPPCSSIREPTTAPVTAPSAVAMSRPRPPPTWCTGIPSTAAVLQAAARGGKMRTGLCAPAPFQRGRLPHMAMTTQQPLAPSPSVLS